MLGQRQTPPLRPLVWGRGPQAPAGAPAAGPDAAAPDLPPPRPLSWPRAARPEPAKLPPSLTLGARTYFERAASAARGGPQPGTAILPRRAPAPGSATAELPVYRAGDPALRLFDHVALELPDDALVYGARVTLLGARDSVRERLLYDLATSRVKAGPATESGNGSVLEFSRPEAAQHYRRLIASLRYFNWSDRPTPGERRIAVDIIDAAGAARRVAERAIVVVQSAAPKIGVATSAGFVPAQPPPLTSMATPSALVIGNGKPLFGTDSGRYALHWWRPAGAVAPPRPQKLRAAPASGAIFSTGARYRVFVSGPGGGRPQAPAHNQRPGAKPMMTLADRAPPPAPSNDAPPLDLSQLFGSDEAPKPGTAWRGRAA